MAGDTSEIFVSGQQNIFRINKNERHIHGMKIN